jgi:hypothetical protein
LDRSAPRRPHRAQPRPRRQHPDGPTSPPGSPLRPCRYWNAPTPAPRPRPPAGCYTCDVWARSLPPKRTADLPRGPTRLIMSALTVCSVTKRSPGPRIAAPSTTSPRRAQARQRNHPAIPLPRPGGAPPGNLGCPSSASLPDADRAPARQASAAERLRPGASRPRAAPAYRAESRPIPNVQPVSVRPIPPQPGPAHPPQQAVSASMIDQAGKLSTRQDHA